MINVDIFIYVSIFVCDGVCLSQGVGDRGDAAVPIVATPSPSHSDSLLEFV
jgi:hypothetical protein